MAAATRSRYLPAIATSTTTSVHIDDATLEARRRAREERRKPKRIVIFCNGDVFFKGKKFTIRPSRYVSYNDLLQDLTYNMPQSLYLPNGVRQLFSPSSGRRVGNVTDLRDGAAYVCAGNETFKPVKYGESSLTPWGKGRSNAGFHDNGSVFAAAAAAAGGDSQFAGYNAFPPSRFMRQPQRRRRPSIGGTGTGTGVNRFAALRGSDATAAGAAAPAAAAGQPRPPKVVTVVKDGDRPRQVVKVLLNRRGIHSFQQVLADISDSFGQRGKRERLQKLFTVTGREVHDIQDLFRDDELFVGYCSNAPTLEGVADLLEELYPGNGAVKSLLKDWERRLTRLQKRQQQQQQQQQHQNRNRQQQQQRPQRLEERDSGYDESEQLPANDGKATPTKSERMKQAIEARRHSRPLPLLHESPTKASAASPTAAAAAEEAQRRKLEEQRLADEAATARKDKQQRLGKQREASKKQKSKQQQQQQQQQQQAAAANSHEAHELPKTHAVLPPIPSTTAAAAAPAAPAPDKETKKMQKQQKPDSSSEEPQQKLPPIQQQQQQASPKPSPKKSLSGDRLLSTVKEEKESLAHAEEREEELEEEEEEEQPKPSKASPTRERRRSARKVAAKAAGELAPAKVPTDSSSSPRPLIRPISSNRIIKEQYELGRVMGDGNFAVVRACTKKDSQNEFAMKVIDKAKLRGKEQMVINEVRIMKLCSHSNIVRLLEEYETKAEIYLVMELVKGGDLFDAISQVVKFNEVQSASMVQDVANALHYLHSRAIVHRDLKPENLLVYRSKDQKISLKLGDFGLAMEVEKPIYTVCGTPTYVAPEILEEKGYGLEVDLWALGVITYILLCGFPPFRSRDRRQTELFQFIKAGQFEFISPYWDHISVAAKDLIQRLLVVDRKRRYSAIDVLCHQWVVNVGGSKKLTGGVTMKEHQSKMREKLVMDAAEALDEFKQLKATSVYGNVA